MKKINNLKRNGFTLIELMVVIAIIAILAIVGITIFSGQQASARDARRSGDIESIQKAMENHYVATIDPTTGTYTCPDGGGTIDSPGYCPLEAAWFAGGVVPTDPGGQKAVYCFYATADGSSITKLAPQAQWGTSCPNTTDASPVAGTLVAPGVGAPIAGKTVTAWMVCGLKESNPVSGNYTPICQNSSQQ